MTAFSLSQARTNMVDGQIRPNRVTNPTLLDAFESVPREKFVPADLAALAYADASLAVAPGRRMLQPMLLARTINAAEVAPDETVVILGGLNGYTAAIVAHLAHKVIVLEHEPALVDGMKARFEELGLKNIEVRLVTDYARPLLDGQADVMIVEGGIGHVPDAWLRLLRRGARVLAPVLQPADPGAPAHFVMTRHLFLHDALSPQALFDVAVDFLPGLVPVAKFKFA